MHNLIHRVLYSICLSLERNALCLGHFPLSPANSLKTSAAAGTYFYILGSNRYYS